jgi:hypothetical protein
MQKVCFNLIQRVWKEGKIPSSWKESIVVPIPKAGDPTDTNNYRGIALSQVGLKLLTKTLARRLSTVLEGDKVLCKEQAVFREREECLGQYAALLEVLQRRKIEGLDTYAAFVDIRKAYDTVPHHALLAKLSHIGITGQFAQLLEAIYADMRTRV